MLKNTELFFARRLSAGKGGRANGVMTNIATLSVAIGLGVMILSLSIIFGFKREITHKMTGFLSHVQILHYDNSQSHETLPISSDQPFLDTVRRTPGFVHMNRYAVKAGILRGEDAMHGIMLKGVGTDFDWSFFKENLTAGSLPDVGSAARTKQVLISKTLASQMNLGVGSKFEVMFIQTPPRRDLFRVSGIYETSLAEIDNVMVMCDIRDVQRLNKWDSTQITGFEITSADFDNVKQFSDDIFARLNAMSDRLPQQLMVTNIRESKPMVFDWLDTHDLNAAIIIVVMLLVAIFNMIASLLIIILEKTSMIGVLKALGMRNWTIQKIFIIRSSYIALKGMLWGNIAGLAVCYIQKYTGFIKLDAEGYFITQVPIYVDWTYVCLLNAGVFLMILAFMPLPTMVVSRILPEKSIKYE